MSSVPSPGDHADPSRPCPTCGAALRGDGPCEACLIELALSLPDSPDPDPGEPRESFERISEALPLMTGGGLPREFGPYTLVRQLAVGGMGLVFEARHRTLSRRVALKMIRFGPFATSNELVRFRTEVAAVSRLSHPNIVPVYEVGEIGGHHYFTMQLFEGGSLADRIAASLRDKAAHGTGPGLSFIHSRGTCRLAPLPAARLISAVARAVHHAHQHGILHRDLKPSNILLDGADEPHLGDFGLAKLEDTETSGITLSAATLGTPDYMAPEQAAGRVREITVATDVWGLGAILYQLLTGRKPFRGTSVTVIMNRLQREEPLAPDRLVPEVGGDLSAICLRCLEKDPGRRFSSAEEVAQDLERWIRGEPVRARPVSDFGRLLRWSRRNRGVATLGSLTVILFLVAVFGISREWGRAETARRLAEENAYFGTITSVLAAREHFDFGQARRLLAGLPEKDRGFEWRLLKWLSAGDQIQTVTFSNTIPQCLAWWPQKQRFAVLTDQSRLHLFDPATADSYPRGSPQPQPAFDAGAAPQPRRAFTISPDGRRFACAAGDMLTVADATSGKIIHERMLRRPTGDWLDTDHLLIGWSFLHGGDRKEAGWILDVRDGTERPLPQHLGGPVAVSRDRRWVAASRLQGDDGSVQVWSAATFPEGTPVASLRCRVNRSLDPGQVVFSDDGRYAAVVWGAMSIGQREVLVYDLPTGNQRFFQHLRFSVNAIAFSPSNNLIAIASEDSVLRTFRFLDEIPKGGTYDDDEMEGSEGIGSNGPEDPPSKLLTRTAQGGRAGFLLGHAARIRDVAFTRDAQSIVTVSDDGSLRRWPILAPAPRGRLSGVETATFAYKPAASENGRWIAVRRSDRHGCWWDRTLNRTVDLGADEHPMAVLPDGRMLSNNSERGVFTLWDLGGPEPVSVWKVEGTGNRIGTLGALTPDGNAVLGFNVMELFSVNLESHAVQGPYSTPVVYGDSSVSDMAVDPTGRWVALTTLDHIAQIRPVDRLDQVVTTLLGSRDFDTAVAFHPDGTRLFVGNEDGFVRVFSTSRWNELPRESFRAQRGAVTALAFSSDGTTLATSGDETLKLWNGNPPVGEPRRQRLELRVSWPRNWIRFADHDQVLLHSGEYRPLEAWEAPR